MSHTPSAPQVTAPASATDPRYSTSGILNAQIKEKNRQGLLSTYGGRAGKAMDINKFANAKINMRDPSAVSILEQLSDLYSNVAKNSQAKGVGNNDTSSKRTAKANIATYNASIDQVNNMLSSYKVQDSQGLTKAGSAHNFDKRTLHDNNYAANNYKEVDKAVANMGATGQTFNDVEARIKNTTTQKKKS